MVGNISSSRKGYARQAYQVNIMMKIQDNEEPIRFAPAERGNIIMPHDDSMVIAIVIAKHPIGCVLIDNGSFINLIYWN